MVGDDVGKLYAAYARSDFDAAIMPIASITTTEAEAGEMTPETAAGHISCGTYFASLDTPANRDFVASYKAHHGGDSIPTMCAEAAYAIVYVVADGLARTQVAEPQALIKAVHNHTFEAAQGPIRIDGENNHAHLWCRIARIGADGKFNIVYESSGSIKPDPYMVEAESAPKDAGLPPESATVSGVNKLVEPRT